MENTEIDMETVVAHNGKTLTQYDTPIHKALEEQRLNRLAHFDVPGHKGGRGNKELRKFLGEDTMRLDMNSMKPLDNLCHPTSVIKDAQALAAQAFGADEAFFIVNGATAAVVLLLLLTVSYRLLAKTQFKTK